ncbi:fasciclin-2 isoform X2 [Thrips palmi]|uniref:Fasciclin-2 isoform X2 n=1 Tax=Thrips palmi TaxID=161013 RepID=A0A6P8ZGL4_THRPL|nr:fasciclin-2 isoform X2 [Thrips palmi]
MKTRKMTESGGGGRWWIYALLLVATFKETQSARTPELMILPSPSVQTKPIGKNVLLTCRANVENLLLLTDMQWLDPNNRTILNNEVTYTNSPQRMHTEQMPTSLALIIPALRETEAGVYTCTATYANSEKLYKSVRIETIVAITWEDAPEEQFPILNKDFKVRCKVTAQPAPAVDWTRNGEMISTGGRYVVETDGLTIQRPVESDDGVYTCRAIVIQTGELAQRDIHVEVHTPPTFEDMLASTKIVEGETATIRCRARGKPKPTFAWIKASTQQNMASADRFKVNPLTGDMIISGVRPEDSGDYKCVASNKASTVEKTVLVNVLVKPRISDFRNLSVPINTEVRMECRASGNPLPTITFKKLNQQARPYVLGRQPTDQRIELTSVEDPSRREAVGTLRVLRLGRYDDGLYVCIASNEGGEATKNGHLSIQFPPSFASTPVDVWSWGQNPVNISCLAESIPNATITWKLNDREVERDPNVQKLSSGPQSIIKITPRRREYYGVYKCIASNILGTAETTITLKEAIPPSEVLQAKIESMTATTITFSFVGPQNFGGRPLKAYAAQIKKSAQPWEYAYNKTWPADSTYVLENLEPQMEYNFRFAAANEVGFSNWAANVIITMPRRAAPEEPRILNPIIEEGYVVSPYSDRMEVRWKIPADNGEAIDKYQIRYCPVKRDLAGYFVETGELCQTMHIPQEHSSVELNMLHPDTFYRVELQAHNMIGYSVPGRATFKTARDPHVTAAESLFMMSSGVIVGIVVASLLVLLLLIDLFCFCVNSAGLLMLVCESFRGKPKDEDAKLGGLYGWRFPLPYCSNKEGSSTNSYGSGSEVDKLPDASLYIEEKEPLKEVTGINGKEKLSIEIVPMVDNNLKKDTMVDYDFKNSIARTGFVGKDSAV